MKIPDNISDEHFETAVKYLLEKELLEEFRIFEEEKGCAYEPDYSDKYKQFINNLIGKKIYDTKNEKRKKIFWGAAVCACFVIILSVSTIADIKNTIRKIFAVHDNGSIHITQHNMNMDYDLEDVPESWEYIYIPEYLPGGFNNIESFECSDEEIDIIFSNSNKDTIDYRLYKEDGFEFLEDNYEVIDNNGTSIYYAQNENIQNIVYKVTDIYIKVSSEDVDKNELMQIIKNIKIIGI